MKNTFLSTLKVAAISVLLSAVACNDTNVSEVPGETATTLSDTSANELNPTTSTVMNVEGTGTVETRQIQATNGGSGATSSEAVTSGTPSNAPSTSTAK